jgi:hypothetical protein
VTAQILSVARVSRRGAGQRVLLNPALANIETGARLHLLAARERLMVAESGGTVHSEAGCAIPRTRQGCNRPSVPLNSLRESAQPPVLDHRSV